MIKPSLKSQATSGILWNAVEKILAQGGRLLSGIILARILMPEDFGLIGMLTIFIVISSTFVNGGLGSGLIQKKRRTDIDYSTVFVFNVSVSVLIYIILFFTAPLIADFYELPQLIILTRVFAINIIISSFSLVHRVRFIANIDFESIAKINIVSVVCGGTFGIYFAYHGYGVWALVVENLVTTTISATLFWYYSKWKPLLLFSTQSFKTLFGFGWKLLLSTLINQSFNNLYNITIGKIYLATELGFYTKAVSMAELTAGTVTDVLHQVTFPILASLQDSRVQMISVFSRMIRMSAFLILPAMTLAAILADPLIRLILTEKWLPAVPLLQLMCFARIFYPINSINMNALNAIGRSDLYLKIELTKIPFTIVALIFTIPFGVKTMVMGHVVVSLVSFYINGFQSGKIFGYGPLAQLRDMMPMFIVTAFTALIVFIINLFIDLLVLKLIIGVFTGLVVYMGSSYLLKIEELKEVYDLFQNLIIKNK